MAISFRVENVTYHYPGEDTPLLRNVTLEIPAGSITAVLGRSGVGKSTLLYLLGLLWEGPLDQGRIAYGDHDAQPTDYGSLTAAARAHLRLYEFGFVLQSCYLLPTFTCDENIGMPLLLQGVDEGERKQRVRELMEPAGLGHKYNCLAPFSGGERRRISLLRGIVHKPLVLFADEPLSNLDRSSATAVWQLMKQWHAGQLDTDSGRDGRTLLLVMHDVRLACEIATHFIVFHYDGPIAQNRVLTRDEVMHYGGPDVVQKWIDCDSSAGHTPGIADQ